MIRTTDDPEADATFIRSATEEITSVRTEAVSPGFMLDFADAGELIGILDVKERPVTRPVAA